MRDKLKNIKLIVIDIDGTLVDNRGNIGKKTHDLALKLKQHGIFCTLSSARSWHYSYEIAKKLEIDIPIITLDGALIRSFNEGSIYKGSIRQSLIDKVVEVASEYYGKIAMADENYLYITKDNSLVKEFTRLSAPIKEVNSYSELDHVLEILVYCEDKASVHIIKSKLRFPHTYGTSVYITKSPSYDYYLITIKKNGSDKLDSLKRLVKHLGLKRKNVAVIGDWHNDMPLFSYGAFNIAVQNAIPELKRKADYITKKTNDEDAVGEVLELVYERCCAEK